MIIVEAYIGGSGYQLETTNINKQKGEWESQRKKTLKDKSRKSNIQIIGREKEMNGGETIIIPTTTKKITFLR